MKREDLGTLPEYSRIVQDLDRNIGLLQGEMGKFGSDSSPDEKSAPEEHSTIMTRLFAKLGESDENCVYT
jgi:hypothetical protein